MEKSECVYHTNSKNCAMIKITLAKIILITLQNLLKLCVVVINLFDELYFYLTNNKLSTMTNPIKYISKIRYIYIYIYPNILAK